MYLKETAQIDFINMLQLKKIDYIIRLYLYKVLNQTEVALINQGNLIIYKENTDTK